MSRIERAEFLADRSIRLAPWVALLVAWNLVGYDVVTSLDVQQVVQLVVSAVLVAFLLRAVMRPRAKVHATPAAGDGVARRAPGPSRIATHPAWGRLRDAYRDGDFAVWVLARVEPDASTDEVLQCAALWRPQWEASKDLALEPASVALHEAAHAVVADALGCTVTHVTTVPRGGLAGATSYVSPIPRLEAQDVAWIAMVVALAGRAADHARGLHDSGSTTDVQRALALAASIISGGRCPRGYRGPLTTDAMIAAARDRASSILY